MIIVGQGALARADGAAVLARRGSPRGRRGARRLERLQRAAHRGGARRRLDLGFVPGEGGLTRAQMAKRAKARASSTCSSCSAPTRSTCRRAGKAFVVYIGTHGDRRRAPRRRDPAGRRLHRKDGTYVNTEGRVQMAERAVFPPGEAREDWAILRALSACWARRCRTIRSRSCAQDVRGPPASSAHRSDRRARGADVSELASGGKVATSLKAPLRAGDPTST
jgi:NADH-quinone oxidoreductase subunit G